MGHASKKAALDSAQAEQILFRRTTGFRKLIDLTNGVAGAALAAGAAFASFKTIESAIDAVTELGQATFKLQRETGLSAEQASELIAVFQHFGLGADAASRSIGIFAKKLKGISDEETGVVTGGKSAAAILGDLGIKATDAAGNIRPFSDLLPELSEAFRKLPNGLEKTGLALQLFGRSGKELLPILNLGSDGIKEVGDEAKKLGIVLSQENVDTVKAYTFAQRDLGHAFEGLKVQLAVALLPLLTSVDHALIAAQPHVRAFVRELQSDVPGALRTLHAPEAFSAIVGGFEKATDAAGGMENAIKLLALEVVVLGAAFAAAKIFAFVQGLQAAAAAAGVAEGILGLSEISLVSFNPVVAGAVALGVALVGADAAARHFTGSGLIDFLTGAAKAHRLAADAAHSEGEALKELQLLAREGVAPEDQQRLEIQKQINNELRTQAVREAAIAEERARIAAIQTGPQRGRGIVDRSGGIDERAAAQTEQHFKNIQDLIEKFGLGFEQINEIVQAVGADSPLGRKLVPVLEAARKAAQEAAGGIEGLGAAIGSTAEQVAALGTAIDNISKNAEGFDPLTAAIQASITALEAQKEALASTGANTDALDHRIAGLNAALQHQTTIAKVSHDILLAYGTSLRAAGVSETEAEQRAQALSDELNGLPDDVKIKIAMVLPDLEMTRLATFLKAIQQGFTVDIALRIATAKKTVVPQSGFLPGLGGPTSGEGIPGLDESNADAARQAWLDAAFAANTAIQDFGDAATAAAGAGDAAKDAGNEMSYLQKVLQAASDGTISLAEATELNISVAQAAVLELEVARSKEAEQAFRTAVALNELVLTFPGLDAEGIRLAVALKQIQDHLRETGETINQFIEDTAADALEGFRSAFQAIFQKPTRETLEIQKRLAQLQLTRARRVAGGATDEQLKDIDKQIKDTEGLLDLREKEADLLKVETELRDKSVQTDADVVQQAELLGRAIENSSDELVKFRAAAFFDTLAHINVANALNEQADRIRAMDFAPAPAPAPAPAISQDEGGIVTGPQTVQIGPGLREAFIPFNATPRRARSIIEQLPVRFRRSTRDAISRDEGGIINGPQIVRIGAGVREAFVPFDATTNRVQQIMEQLPGRLISPASSPQTAERAERDARIATPERGGGIAETIVAALMRLRLAGAFEALARLNLTSAIVERGMPSHAAAPVLKDAGGIVQGPQIVRVGEGVEEAFIPFHASPAAARSIMAQLPARLQLAAGGAGGDGGAGGPGGPGGDGGAGAIVRASGIRDAIVPFVASIVRVREIVRLLGGGVSMDQGGVVDGPQIVHVGAGVREAFVPFNASAQRAHEIMAQLPQGIPAETFLIQFSPTVPVGSPLSAAEAQRIMHGYVDELFGTARSRARNAGTSLSSGIG